MNQVLFTDKPNPKPPTKIIKQVTPPPGNPISDPTTKTKKDSQATKLKAEPKKINFLGVL